MANSDNTDEREFEEGAPGTQKGRKNDPLTEYSDKEAMTPAKIKAHEPTAVSRDPNDQKIASEGQTGTGSEEALEEYRRKGMTKVGDDNTTSGQQQQQGGSSVDDKASQTASTVKEGAESTFDKLKAGAKAMGKKVTDPDTSLGEEYNKEKSQ
ncbi:MAG TPA: hypothetical protein VE595_05465 [Nitrososphaeraceae archaeon]|nr:hypothetical protein [Nitrososphaeraceae archaeon]